MASDFSIGICPEGCRQLPSRGSDLLQTAAWGVEVQVIFTPEWCTHTPYNDSQEFHSDPPGIHDAAKFSKNSKESCGTLKTNEFVKVPPNKNFAAEKHSYLSTKQIWQQYLNTVDEGRNE